MLEKFKKDKPDKGTYNLREIAAIIDSPDEQGTNSSTAGQDQEFIPIDTIEVSDRGRNSAGPNTRESSRDRMSQYENAFENLIDDLKEDESFKNTITDGLGRIVISNTAQLRELSKKAKVPYVDNLDDTILNFNEYKDKLHRSIDDRINDQINRANMDMDQRLNDKLLERELAYHDQTETIKPPTVFAIKDVLINQESKSNAANNAFPTKRKFTGSLGIGQPTIVEFLKNMNAAQRKCNLSKFEFTEYLNLCCTGQVFEDVSSMIDAEKTLEEIYQALLMAYDKRLTPKAAKLALDNYRPPMDATLNSVSTDIMKLSQRACLQYGKGAQGPAYDTMSIHALINALPYASQLISENCLQELNSRTSKMPTFADFTRALAKYGSTINREYERYKRNKADRNQGSNYNQNSYSKPRMVRSAQINQLNRAPGRNMNYRNPKNDPRRPPNKNPFNRNIATNNQFRKKVYQTNNEGPNTQAYQSYNGNNRYSSNDRNYNGNRRYESNGNNSNGRYQYGSKNRNDLGIGGKLFCQLCGKNNHKPSSVCYAMRDDRGNVQIVNPSTGSCSICKQETGQTLFHPEEFCHNRPLIKRMKQQGTLRFPSPQEREELDKFATGKFQNRA
jgi:hypothetical protein